VKLQLDLSVSSPAFYMGRMYEPAAVNRAVSTPSVSGNVYTSAPMEMKMRGLKLALAVAFTAAGLLTVSAVGQSGTAEAKAHITKGKPGMCGMGKYYSKKEKGCMVK
jgi:hypothetical protein